MEQDKNKDFVCVGKISDSQNTGVSTPVDSLTEAQKAAAWHEYMIQFEAQKEINKQLFENYK